jgi:hypothetical protein
MSRETCNHFAREILSYFGLQNQIRFSLGEFKGNWDSLKVAVANWWREYKAWEEHDTLVEAYREKRLTVKGTSDMNYSIQFQDADRDPNIRYQNEKAVFGASVSGG